jgi:cyclic pyranopterin phosphate synthase
MLTHIDKKGNAKIIDITKKKATERIASSSGKIFVSKKVIKQIKLNNNKKGDIFTVSKIAGIMAAKKTSDLIPLCHPLKLEDIYIDFNINENENFIEVITKVKCEEKTGVEMEAITATSICLVTIYDMCKAIDSKMLISEIKLLKKYGGKKTINNNF